MADGRAECPVCGQSNDRRNIAMSDKGTPGPTMVELDRREVALIIGEEGESMSVRVVAGEELPDDVEEVPAAHEIAIALAMRLLKDPDFHEEVLDWYYSQPDEEEDEG
jgi:hypothetical protein